MATSIADLMIKMDVDSARFRKELKAVDDKLSGLEKQAKRAGDKVQQAFDSMASSAKAFAIGLVSMEAAKGLVNFVKGSIDAADAMGELAQKTGVSVEQLSKLQYAAKFSGVDIEGVATGLKKLAKNADEAANGGKAQSEAFKRIGVSVKDSSGQIKSLDSLLGDIADRFATYEDGAAKSALAQELFGKAGAELIPFLNEGSKGIKKLGDEAERLGIVLSPEMAEQSAKFNDTLDRLAASSKASGMSIANYLLPSLQKLATQWERYNAARGLGETGGAIADMFGMGPEAANNAAKKIQAWEDRLRNMVGKVTRGAWAGAPIDSSGDPGENLWGMWGDFTDRKKAPGKPRSGGKDTSKGYVVGGGAKELDALYKREAERKAAEEDIRLAAKRAKLLAEGAEQEEDEARALAKHADIQQRVATAIEQTNSPLESYIERVKELNELQPYLTASRFARAQQKLNDDLAASVPAVKDYNKVLEGMQFTAEKTAFALTDILSEHIFDGFRRGLAGLVEDFARAMFQMAVRATVARTVGNLFNLGAAATGGGILGLTSAPTPNDAGNVIPLAEMSLSQGGSPPVILNLSHRSLDMTVRDAIQRELATARATK